MNDNTRKNLFEYGTYFKRTLQLAIVSIIVSFVGAMIIALGVTMLSFGLITFGGIVLFGVVIISIIILVFQIMMFIRIANAKNSSPHPELVKSYNFFLISLICSGVGAVIAIIDGIIAFVNPLYFSWTLTIISTLASLGVLIANLLGWQSLGKYIAAYSQETQPSQGFMMVSEGIKTYITTVYVVIVANILSFIVAFIGWGTLIVAIVSLVASIVMFIAQFKIANGMIMIFGNAPQFQPATQQYGAPVPSVQPTTPSAQKERYCSKCGTKIVGEAEFCTSCGETLL